MFHYTTALSQRRSDSRYLGLQINTEICSFLWVVGTPCTHVETQFQVLGILEKTCLIYTETPVKTCSWKLVRNFGSRNHLCPISSVCGSQSVLEQQKCDRGNLLVQHTAPHCTTMHHAATTTTLIATQPFRDRGNFLQQQTRCNTLQHTATRCNTLQHTVTHCSTLQHTATHCNTLRHTATHCNTLQNPFSQYLKNFTAIVAIHCNNKHAATHGDKPQHAATHYNTLHQPSKQYWNILSVIVANHCNNKHTAKLWDSLQYAATHCNTLQHNALYCISLASSTGTS